ncbi:MAG: hypothetical protein ABSG53_22835, partial [Thermoguttaceae bacterium]
RQRNRPAIERVFQQFFPAAAGAWLLLAVAGLSLGGGIDDPCKFPSLGCLFKSNPGFHHHRDDASGTLCAPCYGYHPTCWRQWPDCCVGCPPPPVPVPTESPAAPPRNLPPPEVTPTPQGVPAPTLPSLPPLPGSEPAIPPAPTTTPLQQRPPDLIPLPPPAKPAAGPGIDPRVDLSRALPSNPPVTRLRDAPMLPGVHADVVLMSASLPTRAARPEEDLGIAPMPPELPHMAR